MPAYIKYPITMLTLLICLYAPLQDGTAGTVQQLVGRTQKEWTFERFEQYMGDKKRCKAGESWRFHRDGKLTVKKCVDERTVTEERQWSVERLSALDVLLRAGGKEYLILFAKSDPLNKSKEKMILRTKSDSKTEPTKDLVFYHEIER